MRALEQGAGAGYDGQPQGQGRPAGWPFFQSRLTAGAPGAGRGMRVGVGPGVGARAPAGFGSPLLAGPLGGMAMGTAANSPASTAGANGSARRARLIQPIVRRRLAQAGLGRAMGGAARQRNRSASAITIGPDGTITMPGGPLKPPQPVPVAGTQAPADTSGAAVAARRPPSKSFLPLSNNFGALDLVGQPATATNLAALGMGGGAAVSGAQGLASPVGQSLGPQGGFGLIQNKGWGAAFRNITPNLPPLLYAPQQTTPGHLALSPFANRLARKAKNSKTPPAQVQSGQSPQLQPTGKTPPANTQGTGHS